MRKQLKFTKEPIARLVNSEPFIVCPDEGITLDIDTFYDLSGAIVTMTNNDVKKVVKLTTPLVIPPELVFAGRLHVSVDLYQDGNLIKHWDCLPIKIIEADGETRAFDEFTELEKRVAELETKTKIIL